MAALLLVREVTATTGSNCCCLVKHSVAGLELPCRLARSDVSQLGSFTAALGILHRQLQLLHQLP
jgi:hypothetical protein